MSIQRKIYDRDQEIWVNTPLRMGCKRDFFGEWKFDVLDHPWPPLRSILLRHCDGNVG
jgi:hypothetical protein